MEALLGAVFLDCGGGDAGLRAGVKAAKALGVMALDEDEDEGGEEGGEAGDGKGDQIEE